MNGSCKFAGTPKTADSFRLYLPDLTSPRFVKARSQDTYSYADNFNTHQEPPWLYKLTQTWAGLYDEPFVGITSDGKVKDGLFPVQDEGVEIDRVVIAAKEVIDRCDSEQKSKMMYKINAKEWRAWSNPEVLLRPFGIRLEDVSGDLINAIMSLIQASFSAEGFEKAVAAMRINHFLGEVVDLPRIMNQYSYNFLMFGSPSTTEAWGWTLYGHHLCLNVFFKGRQMVISPTFTGAEPNVIDHGQWAGTRILNREGELGLSLMQSLDSGTKRRAQTYKLLQDPAMPCSGDLISDRWNKDDQRHLCGAFRDNRIVPYEGICVGDLGSIQQRLVLDIAEQFLLYLPKTARHLKKAQISERFSETWFSWIGGYGDEDAFYYRIQSPVIILEFDHHSGVFLSNTEPAKFHTHTIVRTPNGGDYGSALRSASEKL